MTITAVILWVYIVLLLVGGAMGFIKAKSKVSLIMASVFAILLAVCNLTGAPLDYSKALLLILLVVFSIRLVKTKKFMPSGLMLVITMIALNLIIFIK